MKIYEKIHSGIVSLYPEINQAILAEYFRYRDSEDIRKTHYFQGRYENLYLPAECVPSLTPILEIIRNETARQLGRDADSLKIGFWFNEMGPGHCTTLHAHDDFDEVMSAVYYIRVPENSGNIVFHENGETREVEAKEGMYILFPPELKHEVTENRSDETRLSVGINIGAELDED